MWKIVHFAIKRFGIQSTVSFGTINIKDVAYEKLKNVSVYNIIRDKLFKNNDMLSSILTE
jgi:hypothetical protein